LAELAKLFEVYLGQIVAWKAQLQEGAAGVFGAGAAAIEAAHMVDLKLLHAKIGELARQKDFLPGALNKARLAQAQSVNRPRQEPVNHAGDEILPQHAGCKTGLYRFKLALRSARRRANP